VLATGADPAVAELFQKRPSRPGPPGAAGEPV